MRIAQVAQAIETHARRKAPVKLCFGGGIDRRAGCRNTAGKGAVGEDFDVLGHVASIAIICMDV